MDQALALAPSHADLHYNRSLLLLPYAAPAFMSMLLWAGFLNTSFGFVNQVLLGGAEISSETLLRWYVLHVLFLPFVIVIFMAIHFWRVRKDGGISGPL